MNLGKIERSGGRVTFRFERRLRHPVEAVWKAIIDPEENETWFGGSVEIEPKPGGRFVSHHEGGVEVVDRVVRLRPPTLLEHTFWEQVNPSALVTWELRPSDEGTVLTLTHGLSLDEIRAEGPTPPIGDDLIFILVRNAAGWHYLLDKLRAALDGESLKWTAEERKALQARYSDLLH